MTYSDDLINRLRARISSIESELGDLRAHLSSLEEERDNIHRLALNYEGQRSSSLPGNAYPWPFEKSEYQRYGRQMIVAEIGLEGWPAPLFHVKS